MNLRSSAIVMKSLPATAWGDALLISREEARRIGYELEQAAERTEALEARALPDTHRVVSVELLKEAAGQISELNTFAAIRAIIEDKENKQCNT